MGRFCPQHLAAFPQGMQKGFDTPGQQNHFNLCAWLVPSAPAEEKQLWLALKVLFFFVDFQTM